MSDEVSEPVLPLEELRKAPKRKPKPQEGQDKLHDYRDQLSNDDVTRDSIEPEHT